MESLLTQSYENFEAILSIDGDDEQTEKACLGFLKDKRIFLKRQKQRLGWVENTNWVLSQAKGEFVTVLPHDDLWHRQYLEKLLNLLLKRPKCVLAYCDVATFGLRKTFDRPDHIIIQKSLKGPLHKRQLSFIKKHFNAVGFRGLIRKEALDNVGLIVGNVYNDFAADTLWMAKFARVGELHRLPRALYRKRYHRGNTHFQWQEFSLKEQRNAWNNHCMELLKDFLPYVDKQNLRREILFASVKRLLKGPRRFRIFRDITTLSPTGA